MSYDFIPHLLKLYGQTDDMKNRYEVHTEKLSISNDGDEIIQLNIFDSELNKYIDPPNGDLIRTVANMNMEYNSYKKNMNDYIDNKK